MVDDLDATYQRTERENKELATFFTACRNLASDVDGINFRITMRTDVYPLLRRYDEAWDKLSQYVHDITWSQADFRTLLFKRIKYQADKLKIAVPPLQQNCAMEVAVEEHYINQILEERTLWNSREKLTYEIIYTLSYFRPRWAIQLCKLAQQEALKLRKSLITKANIDSIWGIYGKKRIEDLIAEHKHQCREVEELINAFRGAERRMSREELIAWVSSHITKRFIPTIESKSVHSPIEVAHFLFRLGFIVARSEQEDGGYNTYEHYYFADMPDFLSSRTNEDFGVVWEIHPCYREALDIQKLNSEQYKRRIKNL